MTNPPLNTDTDLEEILDKFGKTIASKPNGDGPAYAYKQAKAKLQELITQSRIDELESLDYHRLGESAQDVVDEHIATLQSQLKSKDNQ